MGPCSDILENDKQTSTAHTAPTQAAAIGAGLAPRGPFADRIATRLCSWRDLQSTPHNSLDAKGGSRRLGQSLEPASLQTAASLTRFCRRQPLKTHALNGSQRQQGAQQAPAPARW